MITFYLCCLIFGGILLIVLLFTDLESEAGEKVEPEAGTGMNAVTKGVWNVFKFLSFRNAVYFMVFFGLTGVTVSRIDLPAGGAFIAALVMGTFAAFLGHIAMQYLQKSRISEGENLENIG